MTTRPSPSGDDELQQDPLIEKLIPDPSQLPSGVVALEGFLGRSSKSGYWRLYRSVNNEPSLEEFIEFREQDVVHSEALANGQPPQRGTRVFFRSDTQVERVSVHSERLPASEVSKRVQAEFLQGDITTDFLRHGGEQPPFAPPLRGGVLLSTFWCKS